MASTINDERLVAVNTEEEKTLNESNTMYNSMLKDSQSYYDKQIQASKDYADKQTQLQQEQTDFALEKLEQQKDQANKDYIKEQSGAYVDWQKESNRYGAKAEEMASNGFVSSGYGESAQVSMYNTYQNRVMTAREAYNKAVLEYDNMMKDAKLQNSSVLAEIAFNALQAQLELSLQGLQYRNQLLEAQANKQLEIKNMYHNQYQDILQQINTENALAEQIRQYNETLEEEKRQHDETLAEQKRQFDQQMAKSRSSGGGGYSSGGSSGGSSSSGYTSQKVSQPSIGTYEEACAYMNANGASSGVGGLMTKGEWSSRRSAGSNSAAAKYSTYDDYLNAYVDYQVNSK
jgi:uncharacterized membrane protein YgcG